MLSPNEIPEETKNAASPGSVAEPPGERPAGDGNQKTGEEDQVSQRKKLEEEDKRKPIPRWPFYLLAAVVLGFILVVLALIFAPRPNVWTDDAYVSVYYASIAPRIPGQVVSVLVDDTKVVRANQLLVQLDPRDYETAVASAQATLQRDRAQLADTLASLVRQPSIIRQQDAQAQQAQARLAFAQPDALRFVNLASTGAGTVQQRQQAVSTLQDTRALLAGAVASSEAARRQFDVIKAQRDAAVAAVKLDEAQLAQALLNLSYTRILAPVDGMVSERAVQVGNVVAPGSVMMVVVPLNKVYVSANYREVALTHVRSGQHVDIHVDAYGIDLAGTVENIGAASGASFSPIQPNNATGNFTKIVQRLPVKIDIDANQPLAKLLRVGFSVETTIHTGLEDVVGEQKRSDKRVTAH